MFELTPASSGSWSFNVIHSFYSSDGANPQAGLVFDANGALYGTTVNGGDAGMGTVFQLTASGGYWNETVLFNFTGQNGDGANPEAGLVFDKSGGLYGTTYSGGRSGLGTRCSS